MNLTKQKMGRSLHSFNLLRFSEKVMKLVQMREIGEKSSIVMATITVPIFMLEDEA